MKVLGLDPSFSNFGWCTIEDEKDLFSNVTIDKGRIRWKEKTDEKEYDFVDKFILLEKYLRSLLHSTKPDYIAIEQPTYGTSYAEGMYALFIQNMKIIKELKFNVLTVDNNETKSRVRDYLKKDDKSKVTKSEIKLAARKHTGIQKWTGDEADAYWIGHLGMKFWKLQSGQITDADFEPIDVEQISCFSLFVKGPKKGTPKKVGLIHRPKDRYFIWSTQG